MELLSALLAARLGTEKYATDLYLLIFILNESLQLKSGACKIICFTFLSLSIFFYVDRMRITSERQDITYHHSPAISFIFPQINTSMSFFRTICLVCRIK